MGLKVVVDSSRMSALKTIMEKFEDTPTIRTAMAMGLNEHLDRQKRDSVTTVAAQTGLSRGMVEAGAGVNRASAGSLTGAVKMSGGAVFAGAQTSRSWVPRDPRGAHHGDWPTYTDKGGFMKHTFIAFGHIMRRTGPGRGPIQSVYGPVIPNEMLRTDMPNWPRAEGDVGTDLAPRVLRALQFALGF